MVYMIMYQHICKQCKHAETRFAKLVKMKCAKCGGGVEVKEVGTPTT